MKLTRSWTLFAIALSVPVLSVLFLWYAAATAPPGDGEGVGWLGIVLLPIALIWFIAFSAIAVAVAGPRQQPGAPRQGGGWAGALRKVGLFFLGMICFQNTIVVLNLYIDHPSTAIFSAPLLVLLATATCAPFYALWRSVRGLKILG
jgi:hypothetical protein